MSNALEFVVLTAAGLLNRQRVTTCVSKRGVQCSTALVGWRRVIFRALPPGVEPPRAGKQDHRTGRWIWGRRGGELPGAAWRPARLLPLGCRVNTGDSSFRTVRRRRYLASGEVGDEVGEGLGRESGVEVFRHQGSAEGFDGGDVGAGELEFDA